MRKLSVESVMLTNLAGICGKAGEVHDIERQVFHDNCSP